MGGDFYYDPLADKTEAESNLVLVGGGVGINPLVSILLEYRDLLRTIENHPEANIRPGKVHLLYSARTECELVFRASIEKCINVKMVISNGLRVGFSVFRFGIVSGNKH